MQSQAAKTESQTTPAGAFRKGRGWRMLALCLVSVLLVAGCARYNTYYNATRAFQDAEVVRKDRLKEGQEVAEPTSQQKTNYELAIRKCQKILDEYPGSGLTDDALFLMAKSYHRLNSYRMSIRRIELLFANFPTTPFEEESIYLQALNYMFIGDVNTSNELLERLAKSYPRSKFQADALRVQGENRYSLEEWEAASQSFSEYVERFPRHKEHDEIRYKLALSLWELEDYEGASLHLNELIKKAHSRELAFKARLLLARVLYRIGEFDQAAQLLQELQGQAEVYQAQGEVTLVEAENLYAQGRADEAASLLENMPEEWLTPAVKPRVDDLLGWIYFERWELDEARQRFQSAARSLKLLEEPETTRLTLKLLQDYLAAEQSLVDAKADRVPGLKLLQANALLFGLGRPRLALDNYLDIMADPEADSTMVARALYGAVTIYGQHLALPDSARLMEERLLAECPGSPQAYELQYGNSGDLLTYLLELRQQERDAALSVAAAIDTAAADTTAGAAILLPPPAASADSLGASAPPAAVAADSLAEALPPALVPEQPAAVTADSLRGGDRP